jgi:uncharacterized membrane protein
VPNRSDRTAPAAVAALGAVTGLRTTAGPAALGLRGRWGRRGRIAAVLAATGEMAFDKLPAVPPRSDLPSLTGRMISGAFTGRELGGASGAGAAAACALATAYGSQRLRALVGERTGLPDVLIGALEDGVVIAVAAGATRAAPRPEAEADGRAETDAQQAPEDPPDGPGPGRRPSRLGGAGRGLAAAAIGTAAMTSAQQAYLRLTGGAPSSAPEQMGRRIIEGGLGRRVPRKRRAALNQAMHMLYGTAWGLPFGLVVGSLGRRPPASAAGVALGLTAWGVSLVELPALGLSPPPWQQPLGGLVADLTMHLVYGASTAAVYQVLA